jgi:hypothetical protein
LETLRRAGAEEAVRALLARHPADYVALDDPANVASLLASLRAAGAGEQVTTLATRAANAGVVTSSLETAWQASFGREPDDADKRPWGWQDLARS